MIYDLDCVQGDTLVPLRDVAENGDTRKAREHFDERALRRGRPFHEAVLRIFEPATRLRERNVEHCCSA